MIVEWQFEALFCMHMLASITRFTNKLVAVFLIGLLGHAAHQEVPGCQQGSSTDKHTTSCLYSYATKMATNLIWLGYVSRMWQGAIEILWSFEVVYTVRHEFLLQTVCGRLVKELCSVCLAHLLTAIYSVAGSRSIGKQDAALVHSGIL